MRAFRDTAGEEWIVEVNVGSLKRVRDLTGVDLVKLLQPGSDLLEKLSEDLYLLFDCLAALLRPQIEKRGLTPEQFGERLDEAAAEAAALALFEGIIDFFPREKREVYSRAMTKVLSASRAAHERALRLAAAAIESEAFEKAIERAISGNSSTGSPESSESIPTH